MQNGAREGSESFIGISCTVKELYSMSTRGQKSAFSAVGEVCVALRGSVPFINCSAVSDFDIFGKLSPICPRPFVFHVETIRRLSANNRRQKTLQIQIFKFGAKAAS